MKKLLYRFVTSRSFTRSLSIVAVAVVAFAALELLFVQPAFAATKCCTKTSTGAFTTTCYCESLSITSGTACPKTGNFSTGQSCPLPYSTSSSSGSSGGTINSTISCTILSGQNNVDSKTVSQTATMDCTVTGGANPGQAICQFDILYSRPAGLTTQGVQQCIANTNGTSTLTDVAFCGNASNGLVVSGTLNCNPPFLNNPTPPTVCGGNTSCTMNLDGIASVPNGQCDNVFPATTQLAAGQVLSVSAIVQGPSCTGQIVDFSQISTRYCNSGGFNGGAADCTWGTGRNQQNATIIGTTEVAIPFTVDFDPTVLNVTCNPQNNDVWRFTIFGNENLNVTLINQSSLKVEGVSGVGCPNSPVNNNLDCEVQSCPNLGPVVAAGRNPVDLTIDLTVTGSLLSGTAIVGEQHVTTSGQ